MKLEKLDTKFYVGTPSERHEEPDGGEVWLRKVKDGSVIQEDEYVVFLAKDSAFAATLPVYREICAAMGADQRQLDSVDAMIGRLNGWRIMNASKCKVPDIGPGEKTLTDE